MEREGMNNAINSPRIPVGKVTLFLRDKYIGALSSVVQDLWYREYHDNGRYLQPSNTFIYCPDCGDIWFRILFQYGKGWHAACVQCSKCGKGSIDFFPLFQNEIDKWPRGLLEYELTEVTNDRTEPSFSRAS